MVTSARTYRKQPLAIFEYGTRLYAPSAGEASFRVVATDGQGQRRSHKFKLEADARAKAREIETYLASDLLLHPHSKTDRTVGALAAAYTAHLSAKSNRYQERQASLLRHWILPGLAATPVDAWSPARSEAVLNHARRTLAPASVQNIGACMRALVTFAHKSRWLPRTSDPMWLVSYSLTASGTGGWVRPPIRASQR